MFNNIHTSFREKPWNGIGDMLEDNLSALEARTKYLTWSASKIPLSAELPSNNGTVIYKRIPEKYAIMREDNQDILGICASKYHVYQNSDMWDVITTYMDKSGMRIETVGSLKGGKYTWVLLKGDIFEVVKNDPIETFLLFRNAFTGIVPVHVLFTNVRVLSSSIVSIDLSPIKCMYNVRHVGNVISRVAEVERMMQAHDGYQHRFKEILQVLFVKKMSIADMVSVLEKYIFPYEGEVIKNGQIARTIRNKKIAQIMESVDSLDVDIRESAYGLFMAILEWVDHNKITKDSIHEINALRFENAMYTSIDFKTKVMDTLLNIF